MSTMATELKKQTTDQPNTEGLRWKTRIAVLWLIYMGNFAAYATLKGLTISSGYVSENHLRIAVEIAVFSLVPSILAWLSLTLKDTANRWTNFVCGILFSIPIILTVIFAKMSLVLQIKSLADFVLSLLIIWYAWKWPKREV